MPKAFTPSQSPKESSRSPEAIFSRSILVDSSCIAFQSSCSVIPFAFATARTFALSTSLFTPKNLGDIWSSTSSPPTEANISPIFFRSGEVYTGFCSPKTKSRISLPSSGRYFIRLRIRESFVINAYKALFVSASSRSEILFPNQSAILRSFSG